MRIRSAKDLTVYKLAYKLAMDIFELTKRFSPEEKVCAKQPNPAFIAIGLSEFA